MKRFGLAGVVTYETYEGGRIGVLRFTPGSDGAICARNSMREIADELAISPPQVLIIDNIQDLHAEFLLSLGLVLGKNSPKLVAVGHWEEEDDECKERFRVVFCQDPDVSPHLLPDNLFIYRNLQVVSS